MLSITKRPTQLGRHINSRTEFHGDEEIGACDFAVSKIMLESEEFEELLGVGAHARLFKEGEPAEPAFRDIHAIALTRKFENGSITIYVDEEKLTLGGVKLAKISLVPRTGGFTELSLQVQCNPEPEQQALLFKHMAAECECSIRFGREAMKARKDQPELPLDHTGTVGADAESP